MSSIKNITAILYEAEKHQFHRNEKRFKSVEHMLNQRSAIHVDDDYENESSDVDESEIATVEKLMMNFQSILILSQLRR